MLNLPQNPFDHDDHQGNFALGVLNGVLISIALWAIIIGVYMVFRNS